MLSGDLPQTLPLSVLIDGIAREGDPRDEDFVRRFSMWMHDSVAFLRIHQVQQLELIDVVLTFEMKESVRLIITGRMGDSSPGEVTLKVLERDFPHVMVDVVSEAHPLPYDVCTLDYSQRYWRLQSRSVLLLHHHGHRLLSPRKQAFSYFVLNRSR